MDTNSNNLRLHHGSLLYATFLIRREQGLKNDMGQFQHGPFFLHAMKSTQTVTERLRLCNIKIESQGRFSFLGALCEMFFGVPMI